jgi:hypothetical protein
VHSRKGHDGIEYFGFKQQMMSVSLLECYPILHSFDDGIPHRILSRIANHEALVDLPFSVLHPEVDPDDPAPRHRFGNLDWWKPRPVPTSRTSLFSPTLPAAVKYGTIPYLFRTKMTVTNSKMANVITAIMMNHKRTDSNIAATTRIARTIDARSTKNPEDP